MKRKIFFKAKTRNLKIWTHGSDLIQGKPYGKLNGIEIIPETLCQYSGQKAEWLMFEDVDDFIYEGDELIRTPYKVFHVEYIGSGFEVISRDEKDRVVARYTLDQFLSQFEYEKTGKNIYDEKIIEYPSTQTK